LVEFVDLPRVATDGKDQREAMEEGMDALGPEARDAVLGA
jgi:predicted RNase H-like HicB family nuclease